MPHTRLGERMREVHDPLKGLRGHDLITARSRELHRAVAGKVRADAAWLDVARGNVERWIAQERARGQVSPSLLEWKRILEEEPVETVLEILTSETEEADRLRHATPFCGILTPEEREAIFKRYAAPSA
jgi:hypothetical protein